MLFVDGKSAGNFVFVLCHEAADFIDDDHRLLVARKYGGDLETPNPDQSLPRAITFKALVKLIGQLI